MRSIGSQVVPPPLDRCVTTSTPAHLRPRIWPSPPSPGIHVLLLPTGAQPKPVGVQQRTPCWVLELGEALAVAYPRLAAPQHSGWQEQLGRRKPFTYSHLSILQHL